MKITAAVVEELHGPFVVREAELDEPSPGDVLVKVAATGFCHTDGIARDGDLPFPLPGVLGHEGAGTVVAVGDGVTGVREGQDVVLGWPSCGACRNCQAGEPRYCLRMGELVAGGTASRGRRPCGALTVLRWPATSSGSRRSAPTR
jgi:aryl-alcohol dehydrogenase